MNPAIEELLTQARDPLADRSDRNKLYQQKSRNKTRVITFRVPHNAAVQIYDYKAKKARWEMRFFLKEECKFSC